MFSFIRFGNHEETRPSEIMTTLSGIKTPHSGMVVWKSDQTLFENVANHEKNRNF